MKKLGLLPRFFPKRSFKGLLCSWGRLPGAGILFWRNTELHLRAPCTLVDMLSLKSFIQSMEANLEKARKEFITFVVILQLLPCAVAENKIQATVRREAITESISSIWCSNERLCWLRLIPARVCLSTTTKIDEFVAILMDTQATTGMVMNETLRPQDHYWRMQNKSELPIEGSAFYKS